MSRKHNPAEIHLTIDNIRLYKDCMYIGWSSDIGFGEYAISIDAGNISGDSECMDNNEDKDFLKELLKQASEHILTGIQIDG